VKKIVAATLAAFLVSFLTGCSINDSTKLNGSGTLPSGGSEPIAAGNWLITATTQTNPTSSAGTSFLLRGVLNGSSGAVTGTFHTDSSCMFDFNHPLDGDLATVTGSVANGVITLTGATSNGVTLSVTGTLNHGETITGNYTLSAGANNGCAQGDSGSLYATSVPSINGDWSGAFNVFLDNTPLLDQNQNPVTATVSVTGLQQSATANGDGSFPVTAGNLKVLSASCYGNGDIVNGISGTIDASKSSIDGEKVNLYMRLTDGSTAQIQGNLANPGLALQLGSTGRKAVQYSSTICNSSSEFGGYSATGTMCQVDANGNCRIN